MGIASIQDKEVFHW